MSRFKELRMNREKVTNIIYIVVAVLVSMLVVALFIWLLPIILVLLLAGYLYSAMRKAKYKRERSKRDTNQKKKILIIDEVSEDN